VIYLPRLALFQAAQYAVDGIVNISGVTHIEPISDIEKPSLLDGLKYSQNMGVTRTVNEFRPRDYYWSPCRRKYANQAFGGSLAAFVGIAWR